MRNLSERLAVVGTIDSASQSAAEKLTDAIDLSLHRRVLFIINCGVLGASATVDFQVKGATTSGGAYSAIPSTAITQLVKASNDNSTAIFEIAAEAVENLGLGYRYIKGSLLPGTAASQAAVIALAGESRFGPAADYDVSRVVQIGTLVN